MKNPFTSVQYGDNPGQVCTRLRAAGAVVPVRLPVLGQVMITTTHGAASAMLKDNKRFTMRSKPGAPATGVQWWMPKAMRSLSANMLTSDEPDHRRMRQAVDQAFQRRSIESMEAGIRASADRLLNELAGETGSVDIQAAYARRLPLMVISDLFGLQASERDQFEKRAARLSGIGGTLDFLAAIPALTGLQRQLTGIIQRVRMQQARPGGTSDDQGLLTRLVAQADKGEALNDEELLAMALLLLIAGHETTTHVIAQSVLAFERHDDQKTIFLSGDASALVVEECLRFTSAVHLTKPRTVQSGGDFHGVSLKKGDRIMACLMAANRDPSVFDAADQFDVLRKPNPHLSFATGIHFCLGFQLARMEISIALEQLYVRYPNLRLAGEPTWKKGWGMRALNGLPIFLQAG